MFRRPQNQEAFYVLRDMMTFKHQGIQEVLILKTWSWKVGITIFTKIQKLAKLTDVNVEKYDIGWD